MTFSIHHLRRTAFATLILGTLAVAGCGGGPKLAPVSGIVKVDGKPYPNAIVSFQPVGAKGAENPGRGSMGKTDKDDKFVLKYEGQEPGAVVGKHVVRIVTDGVFGVGQDDNAAQGTGSDDYTPPKNVKADPIPPEWFNPDKPKHFDVPPSGTDQANFEITTKKKK